VKLYSRLTYIGNTNGTKRVSILFFFLCVDVDIYMNVDMLTIIQQKKNNFLLKLKTFKIILIKSIIIMNGYI